MKAKYTGDVVRHVPPPAGNQTLFALSNVYQAVSVYQAVFWMNEDRDVSAIPTSAVAQDLVSFIKTRIHIII